MNSKCGVQNKRKCESHESCVCVSACGCQKKSVVQNTKHKMAAPSVLFFATYRRPFKKKVNYKSSKSITSSLFCLNVLIPIDSARDACTLSVPFKVLYVARNSQQDCIPFPTLDSSIHKSQSHREKYFTISLCLCLCLFLSLCLCLSLSVSLCLCF